MESTLWDSTEKEEGVFLEKENPNEWGPWIGSSQLYKMREMKPLLLMLWIIDFHVCLDLKLLLVV